MKCTRLVWLAQAAALMAVCRRIATAAASEAHTEALAPPVLPETVAPLAGVYPWTVARPDWEAFLR